MCVNSKSFILCTEHRCSFVESYIQCGHGGQTVCPSSRRLDVVFFLLLLCVYVYVCVRGCAPQFQILRKLSQEPVHTAMPSSVTPRQLTRLSWPASTPAGGERSNKRTLVVVKYFPLQEPPQNTAVHCVAPVRPTVWAVQYEQG